MQNTREAIDSFILINVCCLIIYGFTFSYEFRAKLTITAKLILPVASEDTPTHHGLTLTVTKKYTMTSEVTLITLWIYIYIQLDTNYKNAWSLKCAMCCKH